jgi:protein translocase SecG subunit
MLHSIQFIIGILLIFLIIPQTPSENIVLRKFNETGLFNNYKQAKNSLYILTWFIIVLFLIVTFVLSI